MVVNNRHISDRTLLLSEAGQILSSSGIGLNDQTGNYYTYYFLSHKPPPDVALPRAPRAERWKTKAWDLTQVPEAVIRRLFLQCISEAAQFVLWLGTPILVPATGRGLNPGKFLYSPHPTGHVFIIKKIYSELRMKNSTLGSLNIVPISPLLLVSLLVTPLTAPSLLRDLPLSFRTACEHATLPVWLSCLALSSPCLHFTKVTVNYYKHLSEDT